MRDATSGFLRGCREKAEVKNPTREYGVWGTLGSSAVL